MMEIHITFCLVFFFILNTGHSQGFDYGAYSMFLKTHVSSDGTVNYQGIIDQDLQQLDAILSGLSAVQLKSLDNDQELAFWINAYNAFTIKLITNHWPLTSIRDIDNGNPWDSKWIPIGGEIYSLNFIEHDILMSKFRDPRIHFAINCAAKSCPPLLNEPFMGDRLDQQLKQQTREFINNPRYNKLSKNSIELSKLFEWYKNDFGNIIDFVNEYVEKAIDKGSTIRFKDYNWALNQ